MTKLSSFNADLVFNVIAVDSSKIDNDGYIKNLADDLPSKGKFLYYFTVLDPCLIVESFKNFLCENKTDIKLTKINAANEKSLNLYVGSSNSIKKRFKEHCGQAHPKTYALKFSQWLKSTCGEIKFYYVEIVEGDQTVLQHLEDGLWREFRPLFGKSGANNKS